MLRGILQKLRFTAASAVALVVHGWISTAHAQALTGGLIREKLDAGEMTAGEATFFYAGIIEGLAQARYIRDGKKPEGRSCIYKWFYEDGESALRKIDAAFERYPDAVPGQVIGTLVAVKCGG